MKKHGICVITNSSIGCMGKIEFVEVEGGIQIDVHLQGLPPGKHGFHIHEAGDLTDECQSACSHFNPYNTVHGGPKDKIRHVGDLGNLTANKHGIVRKKFVDPIISLKGKTNIIGRCVVIHANPDDLGRGGIKNGKIVDPAVNIESLKTGNAGKRVACGVIGWSKKMFL